MTWYRFFVRGLYDFIFEMLGMSERDRKEWLEVLFG